MLVLTVVSAADYFFHAWEDSAVEWREPEEFRPRPPRVIVPARPGACHMSDVRVPRGRDHGRRASSAGGAHESRQRLFVAVPLPDELLSVVADAQAGLSHVSGLRLLGREQLHVTLAFIGEVDEEKARAARAVVAAVPTDLGGRGALSGFLFLLRRARPSSRPLVCAMTRECLLACSSTS
jgi:hypothetical protein